jgi:hypothetical protein
MFTCHDAPRSVSVAPHGKDTPDVEMRSLGVSVGHPLVPRRLVLLEPTTSQLVHVGSGAILGVAQQQIFVLARGQRETMNCLRTTIIPLHNQRIIIIPLEPVNLRIIIPLQPAHHHNTIRTSAQP